MITSVPEPNNTIELVRQSWTKIVKALLFIHFTPCFSNYSPWLTHLLKTKDAGEHRQPPASRWKYRCETTAYLQSTKCQRRWEHHRIHLVTHQWWRECPPTRTSPPLKSSWARRMMTRREALLQRKTHLRQECCESQSFLYQLTMLLKMEGRRSILSTWLRVTLMETIGKRKRKHRANCFTTA